jgi:hypothetical protein
MAASTATRHGAPESATAAAVSACASTVARGRSGEAAVPFDKRSLTAAAAAKSFGSGT